MVCFWAVCGSLSINPEVAKAQIVPAQTVPTSAEQLREIMRINGGERAGNNLFHSFDEFSIPEGMEAVFENALDVENIFTRITGESVSNINGIWRTQSGANLFLVNPNGIIFGQNAQLDIGGSFVGTTARSIQFEGGTEFVADDAESKVTLTMKVPIGLNFEADSGAIAVNGSGNQIVNSSTFSPVEFGQRPTGISVGASEVFALIGNGLNFEGGVVTTQAGEIYLNSVSSGVVDIEQAKNKFSFGENNVTQYEDINLNQQSLIDASGEEVGIISLAGKNINLANSSFVLSQNRSDVSGNSVNMKASESLVFSGNSDDSEVTGGIRTEALGNGTGTDINIFANNLLLENSARIQALTFSSGFGGNVNINIDDWFTIDSSAISSSAFAEGDAGSTSLSTSIFTIQNGGNVTSSTTGTGNAGGANVTADLVKVIGSSSTTRSNISSSSFGDGNSGTLSITTKELEVLEGGSISSSAFGNGNAGEVNIGASESVKVSGISQNADLASPESTIRSSVQALSITAQKAFGLPAIPSANSGNLTINTPRLEVFEKGVVSVQNQGSGTGGTLNINTDSLNVDTNGSITAAAASGNGGNISLDVEDLRLDNGEITATAGNDGNGGNININATTVLAKKKQ